MPEIVCFVAARGTTTVTIAAPPIVTGTRPRIVTTTTAFGSLLVRIRSVIGIGKRDFVERIWRVQDIIRRCLRKYPKIIKAKSFGSFGEKRFGFFFLKIMQKELSVIQKMYDLIIWFVPLINKFPRDHKFTIGDRIQNQLYDVFEEMIIARYKTEKLERLENINGKLDVLRYQTKLLQDFKLIDGKRLFHASSLINEIGVELGSWMKQQKNQKNER